MISPNVLQNVCNMPNKFQAESSKTENNFWKSCEVPEKACIDSHSMTFISPHLGVGRGGVCRTSVSFSLVVNAFRLILVEYFQIWSGFEGMAAKTLFPFYQGLHWLQSMNASSVPHCCWKREDVEALHVFPPVVNALKLILAKYFQNCTSFGGMQAENTFLIFSIDLHSFSYSIKTTINCFFRHVYDCPSFPTQETYLFQNNWRIIWHYKTFFLQRKN